MVLPAQYRSFVSFLQKKITKRWVCATGMYRSIGHVKFPKFQTRIFVEWKAPPRGSTWLWAEQSLGRFPFNKNSGLKFRKPHVLNGTLKWNSTFWWHRPDPSHRAFCGFCFAAHS